MRLDIEICPPVATQISGKPKPLQFAPPTPFSACITTKKMHIVPTKKKEIHMITPPASLQITFFTAPPPFPSCLAVAYTAYSAISFPIFSRLRLLKFCLKSFATRLPQKPSSSIPLAHFLLLLSPIYFSGKMSEATFHYPFIVFGGGGGRNEIYTKS